jgi:hypothetical protein
VTVSDLRADTRGASIALTHVLAVGITTVLVAGLIIGTSGFLDDQRQRAARSGLETVGEQLATEVSYVEGHAADGARVSVATEHPSRVAGLPYLVALTDDGGRCDGSGPCLVLTADTSRASVRVVVPVGPGVPVTESEVAGGDVTVVSTGGQIRLAGGDA